MAEQTTQPSYLGVSDGRLTIDGVDGVSLVEQYGSPLYVFSQRKLINNTRGLRDAVTQIHPRIKICYASKANSNMAVLSTIRNAGGDIEVNSGGELHKAKKIGFRPDQIVFNGVSKTDEEIRDAIEYGILAINVDSLYELDQVARVARGMGSRANVAIRLVPEIVTRSHIGLQTGLLSSKFGLSPAQIDEAFGRAQQAGDAINLAGVHIHVGSQTPDPHPFAIAFSEMWKFIAEFYKKTGHRFTHINIGGGLPVNYLQDAPAASDIAERERDMLAAELDPAEVMRMAMTEAFPGGKDETGLLDDLTIVLEPGRRIVGDTGLLLTQVCNIKHRPETGDTWLLTDAGYSLAVSMAMYKWYYHLISASRAGELPNTPYKVAGPLCDSGDVYFDLERGSRLPNYRFLPRDTGPGDLLALLNTGAYALDQASQYNGRPKPAAVMVKESGEVTLIRRAETYEDLYSMDVWEGASEAPSKKTSKELRVPGSRGAVTTTKESTFTEDLDLTALEDAILCGDAASISAELDVNPHNDAALCRLLVIAASSGDVEIAGLLLGRGAKIDSADRISGMTALTATAEHFQIEMAKFLISSGADVNQKDASGRTPLHIAVESPAAEALECREEPPEPVMAQILLEAGANPSIKDSDESSPLDRARQYSYAQAEELLSRYAIAN